MNTGQGTWTLPTLFATGVFAAHQFTDLPPDWCTYSLLLGGLILACFSKLRALAMGVIAIGWTLWHFSLQLDQKLTYGLIGEKLMVEGRVAGLPENYPDYSRFRFSPLNDDSGFNLPPTMLIYWYRDRPELHHGQKWRLELQLNRQDVIHPMDPFKSILQGVWNPIPINLIMVIIKPILFSPIYPEESTWFL